jgi:hypothetical protein
MVSILLTIVAKGCLPRPGPPKNPKRTSSCAITPAWAYAKHVPGRKTDVSDAQWLQRLHSHGLLRASFRPKGEIVELRAYLRQRERLLEYAASHIQHMQKALTEMNLQLHLVVADITGATGLRIIRAILAGERDPAVLAKPAPAHGLFRPDPGRAIERRDHPTRRHHQDRQRPCPTRAGRRPLLRVYFPNGICAQLLMPCRRCRVSL